MSFSIKARRAPLRQFLKQHQVSTAYELGWSSLKNGELLKAAETDFDVLITTDQNLNYEQNLSGLHLAILVLPFTSWPRLKVHVAEIESATNALKPGDYLVLQLS